MRNFDYSVWTVHGGFTLIETVITLTVLSIAAVGVLSVFTTGIKGSADPLLLNQALQLAQEKMDIIIADKFNASRGFAYILEANYPTETPVSGFPNYNRTVSLSCVDAGNLNDSIGTPGAGGCSSGYTNVTVIVTHPVSGSVNLESLLANY